MFVPLWLVALIVLGALADIIHARVIAHLERKRERLYPEPFKG